jgi:hypothetical protein
MPIVPGLLANPNVESNSKLVSPIHRTWGILNPCWPALPYSIDRRCLLLHGTWSHLWYIQRSMYAHSLICISYRTSEIEYCSLFLSFHCNKYYQHTSACITSSLHFTDVNINVYIYLCCANNACKWFNIVLTSSYILICVCVLHVSQAFSTSILFTKYLHHTIYILLASSSVLWNHKTDDTWLTPLIIVMSEYYVPQYDVTI